MDKATPILGWSSMKERRMHFRLHPTDAEEQLWKKLRNRKLQGHIFRRQHGIGPYVTDFYHALNKTIIELDGEIHNDLEVKDTDEWRTTFLLEHGYKIIRFKNEEVLNNIESVLHKILARIYEN